MALHEGISALIQLQGLRKSVHVNNQMGFFDNEVGKNENNDSHCLTPSVRLTARLLTSIYAADLDRYEICRYSR